MLEALEGFDVAFILFQGSGGSLRRSTARECDWESYSQFDFSTVKKMETYVDKYTEMYWLPLNGYLRHVGASSNNFQNIEQKIAFVKDVCGEEIVYDEGNPGVNIPVHEDGRKRVNVGVKAGIEKKLSA